jgi:hypothetical protein
MPACKLTPDQMPSLVSNFSVTELKRKWFSRVEGGAGCNVPENHGLGILAPMALSPIKIEGDFYLCQTAYLYNDTDGIRRLTGTVFKIRKAEYIPIRRKATTRLSRNAPTHRWKLTYISLDQEQEIYDTILAEFGNELGNMIVSPTFWGKELYKNGTPSFNLRPPEEILHGREPPI